MVILKIIENLQILYFIFLPSLPFIWKQNLISYLLGLFEFIQTDSLLKSQAYEIKTGLFYGASLLMLFLTFNFVLICISYSSKKVEFFWLKIGVKSLSISTLFSNSILTIPALQVFFDMAICLERHKSQCQEPDPSSRGNFS